jgi:phosphatidylglycerophosphate synthase
MPDDTPRADAERRALSVLARFERWALPRIAASLPAWVLPDHLTLVGILAATVIAVAYALSNRSPAWLWVANAGLVVHWFGDSLDGTLARTRHIERPRYGFYLDHLTDAYSTFAIGLGLGLSPYMLLGTGLAIVTAYLVLSINVYLETHVFGVFRYGYGILGPTETRLLLIVLNTFAALTGALNFRIAALDLTSIDVVGVLAAAAMSALLATRVARNLRTLARLEPANVVKHGDRAV